MNHEFTRFFSASSHESFTSHPGSHQRLAVADSFARSCCDLLYSEKRWLLLRSAKEAPVGAQHWAGSAATWHPQHEVDIPKQSSHAFHSLKMVN